MRHLVLWYAHAAPGVPQTPVCGLPLIVRAVLTAQKAGITRVSVAVKAADREMAEALLRVDERITVAWSFFNEPTSLEPLLEGDEPVLLALGDRVFLKDALLTLQEPLDGVDLRTLAAEDSDPESGLFCLSAAVAQKISAAALAEGLHTAPLGFRMEAAVVPHHWCPVRSEADTAPAERLLIKSLTKTADGMVARHLNRKISGPVSRFLAPYPVHPNMVTAVVAIIGLLSGPLNAAGTWAGFALGGFCYYFSSVLDGVDGELSRLKFLASPLGAWLDTITDDVVGTAYLAGLYLGLYRAFPGEHWDIIGGVAMVFFMLTILPRYWLMITSVGAGDHQIIAAQRLAEEKGPIGTMMDAVASTIFRIDFLTFAAFVLSLVGLPWIFAGGFALGTLFSFWDTIVTVIKLKGGTEA